MQYVGSLTARPIKNFYVFFNFKNYRGISLPKKKIKKKKKKKIITIIKKYMHSNYTDQSIHSDERTLIT